MRTRHLVHGLASLLVASFAAPSYAAQPTGPPTPSAFVAELAHNAIHSANIQTLSFADRRRRFEELLDDNFDVPRIARFVLGRYWRKANDTERQAFIVVFRHFLVDIYLQRFTRYDGESFRVIRQSEENTTSTVVYTEIRQPASGRTVNVNWRVVDSDGYRITDMSVAGMSMATVKRDEFASYLQRNGGNISNLTRQLQATLSTQ